MRGLISILDFTWVLQSAQNIMSFTNATIFTKLKQRYVGFWILSCPIRQVLRRVWEYKEKISIFLSSSKLFFASLEKSGHKSLLFFKCVLRWSYHFICLLTPSPTFTHFTILLFRLSQRIDAFLHSFSTFIAHKYE